MSDIASLYIKVDSSGVVTASRDLKDFEGTAQKVEGTTRKVETATDKLKTAVAGLATTYAAVKMAQFVQDMITAQMAMERMTVALKAATGSATAAASEMAYIRAESQRLGLSLQDQAKAYTKLAAAAKGTSLEGKATREIFTAVSEAATALQLSADESAGALYAISQMISKGTVQAEELRGQLGERLPGAFQVAAKAMGVSTAELGKMLEQGKVMSDDFLPKFAKALHDHYTGAIDDASKSSSANLNRMKTAIFELKVSIGEAFGSSTLGAMQAVTTALEKMKKEMESPEAKEAIAALSAEFEKLIINAGQNAPNAIRKTLEALNGIMTFYNALPPEIVEAAGMGIIGRMLFGAGPGKVIAAIALINSALSRFDMNLGSMVSKYREGAGAFQNVIDVVTGKRDWNTGKARGVGINPFNENVMTGKGSNIPGIDIDAMTNPLSMYQTSKFSGSQQGKGTSGTSGTSGTIQKTIDDIKKLAEEWEKMSAKLNARIEGGGLSELAKDLIANQLEADELVKKFGKLKGAIDLIRKAQEASDNEAIAKAEEKALDAAEKRMQEQMQIDKKAYDEAEKMKNDRIKFYDDIASYEDKAYQLKLARIEEERVAYIAMYGDIAAANAKANQDQISALETKIDGEQKWKKSAISNANSILDNLMKCYAEDSSEYKRLQNIKKVAVAAELALEVSKNAQIVAGYYAQASAAVAAATVQNAANESTAVTGAVSSVAAQGCIPIAGFGLVAAMTAVMAGILGIAGIAFGGGSTSTASSGPSYTGQSTVLGAADDEASESISKSYELMQDTYDMQYSELEDLNQSMTELNNNITGLVSSIVRNGDLSGFNGAMDLGTSYPSWWVGISTKEDWTHIPIVDKILGWVQDLGLEIMNGLFGGKTETSINEQGIALGMAGTIRNIMDGAYNINPYEYVITKTTKDGGWFGSDSESYSAYTQAASEQVTSLFRKVFINMSSSLVELAKTFGTDVNDVMNYAFESFQINLLGMSGEEINEALSAKFSEMMDVATAQLFGNIIAQYQQVGEGLYETATRLVMDMASVKNILDKTNQSIPATNLELIALSETLITMAGDLNTLQDAFTVYYDKFTSEERKQADLKTDLIEVLSTMNYSLPAMRDGFNALVEQTGLLLTEEGQRNYVALLKMAAYADQYYTYLEEAADQAKELAESKQSLEIAIMKAEGDTLAATKIERELELAAMDESLRPLQERLYALNDEAAALEAANALAEKRQSLEIELLNLQGKTAEATAIQRANELAAMDESLRPLQERIWLLQDEKNAIAAAQEDLKAAFDAEKEIKQAAHDANIELLNEQKTAAEETLNSFTDVYDRLKSARESMALDTTTSKKQAYQNALSVLATGNSSLLTDDILSTLTSSDNKQFYATEEDYKQSYYQIYNSLFTLEQRAGLQMTAAERQVALLEKQITDTDMQFDYQMDAMDDQLNALLDVNESVLSVAQAIQNIESLTGQKSSYTATAAASAMTPADTNLSAYYRSLGLTQLADTMAIAGDNPSQEAWAAAHKQVYGYAKGGNHPGGWRVVGEDGPELEYTGPSTIYSNSNSKNIVDLTELIAEVKELRKEVSKVTKNTRDTVTNVRLLDEWNEIGMPAAQA